jgi:hypothetical protein
MAFRVWCSRTADALGTQVPLTVGAAEETIG